MKTLALICFPNFSPWRMIKRWLQNDLWRIEAHLLLRKIVDQKKQPFEEIRHFIVYNAILHWSQSHHLLDHGKLDVFDQMLFIPHSHKSYSPMGSPFDIYSVLTLPWKEMLRKKFVDFLLLLNPHLAHMLTDDIHGFLFTSFPGHLRKFGLALISQKDKSSFL